jgi:hypothetical protein
VASHRANSRHLAGLPGRLTRRLFTTFHSAPLPVGPATSRTPTAPPKRTEAAALPPARAAKPPYRSTALHFVKTAETGEYPGQRITSPSYGNARKLAGLRCGLVMRRPPTFVWHLAGQANSSLLPSLLSLPVQKPEDRDPAPHDRKPKAARLRALSALSLADWQPGNEAPVQRAEPQSRFATLDRRKPDAGHVLHRADADMYPGCVRAVSFCFGYDARSCASGPTQNCPHSLRPQPHSHLWPSVLRAGPDGWPSTLQPRPGAAHSRPEVRTARPPRPDTTAARLRALSSARTDSGWTSKAGPAETRRLAAEGKRPPAAKASRPAQDIWPGHEGEPTARARWDFASFGAVMKDAPGSSHKSSYM